MAQVANSSLSRGLGTFNVSTTCQSASKQGENLANHMLQTPGRSQSVFVEWVQVPLEIISSKGAPA